MRCIRPAQTSAVGQKERVTQNRVVRLLSDKDKLDYTYLGNWEEREGNSNVEEGLLTDWLTQFDRDTVTMEDYNEFQGILSGPRMETVKRWDEWCQKRKVVGIGTVDNRGFKGDFKGEAIEVFPYETAFTTVTNSVLE